MQQFNDFLAKIDGYIGGSQWFVFFLLGTGVFFTIYLRFPQIRYFKHAIFIVRGKFDKKGDIGDTSHFQALATALSGTVGTGNIAGVALAIHLGGPAALFWMMITAVLGMCTKFVEVTLSHKYREIMEDGSVAGGPMYYMKNRLNMRWLAVIFAIATIFSSFGTGSLPQINSISNSFYSTFGISHWITGAVLSVLLAAVILGGIKRIARVTDKLVPFMAIVYFLGAISVIIYNYENIIPSFISMFRDVFTGTAATGGFLGAGLAYAFNRGVNRGLFSNEAGQGSAPIAHAAARAHEPVSEGLVAILEPFIDTIIICMLTGMVVLSSGVWNEKFENKFQSADMFILSRTFDDKKPDDANQLYTLLKNKEQLPLFTGSLNVKNGFIQDQQTIIHSRSVAEDVKVYFNGKLLDGSVKVDNGRLVDEGYYLTGRSLLHSAPLTVQAFNKSWFGSYGSWIVALGLFLFAFSTAISWSYYGDRAVTFIFGIKGVFWFRIVFVIGFFLASFTDTTILWTLSGITIVLMALPNLIGILLLHKEMKNEVKQFWKEWAVRFPGIRAPKD
jgi:alanine or glycine:cation symporter, AGCS family